MEIDLRPGQPVLAIIGGALQFGDLQPVLQQGDEGQEQRAVQAVLVQVLRRPVRGGDDHHPRGEQLFEQAADDHRIGDVGDLHFVERQQARVPDDRLGHRGQRILYPRLPGGMHAAVHLLHEGMKMHPALRRDVGRCGEEVHQHGLAAPDPAPEV